MKYTNVLIILAVITVVLIGGYVYIADSALDVLETESGQRSESVTAGDGQGLVVRGEVYGVCNQSDACTRFVIADDGQYTYTNILSDGDSGTTRTGSLPAEIQQQLQESVTPEALREMSKPVARAACDSDTGSVDAVYVIELDGSSYELDSCNTNVEADSAAWEMLGGVWYWFELADQSAQDQGDLFIE